MNDDPFAPLQGSAAAPAGGRKPTPVAMMPIPASAPKPPAAHPTLGRPDAVWTYRDAKGEALGYICRFDRESGKEFRPLVLFQGKGKTPVWRWESWPEPRPLYGLDDLAARPKAPVVVTEGEKSCDAARRLLPDHAVVTSPNGSKSAAKATWRELKGRSVIIWPDADMAGLSYAQAVAKLAKAAGATSVGIVTPPADVAPGWDAADAEAEGMTAKKAAALVAAAKTDAKPIDEVSNGRRRPPQRDSLMSLTEFCGLWHGPDQEAFVTFPVKGHRETWPVRSLAFKRWLASRAYEEQGLVPGAQAIEDTLRVLEARATNDGPERTPWLRTGSIDGKIYIDLCDATWRCVVISASEWEVLERHDFPFMRSSSMRPLPEPQAGEGIGALRSFLNTATEDDFALTVAWLVAALRDKGPYPILVVNGEQGSGKSTFCRLIRSLVDPNAAPIRATPREERDLIVGASNSHIIAYDNLSKVELWLADALCRIATGGGFSARQLHTDRDETVFQATKPVILNGIPHLTERPDLSDRCLTIRLKTIPEEDRQPEEELWRAWDEAQPRVLGALLDAISVALRNLPSTKLQRAGRMADFEKWVVAAEGAFDWEPGTFQAAYRDNRQDAADSAFAADPVASAIADLMQTRVEPWVGTATELLTVLSEFASETIRRTRSWPITAQGLGNRLDRVAPLLRGKGLQIERRHSGVRTVTIAHIDR